MSTGEEYERDPMNQVSVSELLDLVEYLHHRCNPLYHNVDELVNYTQLLEQLYESICEEHGLKPNFKYFHQTFCPCWIDLLEDNDEQDIV